jgi:hypothetical protein
MVIKVIVGYAVALVLALFNGKLVAGAISGMVLKPITMPFEYHTWVPRYLVPFLQGLAMGGVAISTAEFVLSWFKLNMGWAMVAMITVGFAVIFSRLAKNAEERLFHISAGVGELCGIILASYYFFYMAK